MPPSYSEVQHAITLIRTTDLSHLQDQAFLEHHILPALGFNDEQLNEFPSALYPHCGKGLRSWQYPNQFSRCLTSLTKRNVTSYLEIGGRHGGTFIIMVEYLQRFGRLERAFVIDIEPSPMLDAYVKENRICGFLHESSRSLAFARIVHENPWDLVLIDGDHSAVGCRSDYELVRDHARLIMLHDIISSECPGVVETWERIKLVVPAKRIEEYCMQYREVIERTGRPY